MGYQLATNLVGKRPEFGYPRKQAEKQVAARSKLPPNKTLDAQYTNMNRHGTQRQMMKVQGNVRWAVSDQQGEASTQRTDTWMCAIKAQHAIQRLLSAETVLEGFDCQNAIILCFHT